MTRLCTTGLALAIIIALGGLARALPVAGSAYYAQLTITILGIPLNVGPLPVASLDPPGDGADTQGGTLSLTVDIPPLLPILTLTVVDGGVVEAHVEGDSSTDSFLARASGGDLDLLAIGAAPGLLRAGAFELECQLNPVTGPTSHAAIGGVESGLLPDAIDNALWASPPPNTGMSIAGLGDVFWHEVEKEQVGDLTFYRYNGVRIELDADLSGLTPILPSLIGGEFTWGHVECAGTRPIPTTVTPSTGPAGTTVQIEGSGFLPGAVVEIGGVPATSVNVISDQLIEAEVPELRGSGTEAWAVSVTTHVDRGTLLDAFTSDNPLPGTVVNGDAFGVSLSVEAPPLIPFVGIGPVPVAQMPEGGGFDTDSLVGIGNEEDGGILGGGILGAGLFPDGLLLAGAINASVNGAPAGVFLQSEVTSTDVNLGGGLLSFASATVTCRLDELTGELVGSTSIVDLASTLLDDTIIEGILDDLEANVPNIAVSVGGLGEVVLNEQIADTDNGTETLTVRGLRITLLGGLGELILFEANCSAGELQVGPPEIGPLPGSITPPTGPLSGGTVVTITGSNFVPGDTEVLFGENAGTDVTVSPDGMSLTVVTPPGDEVGPVDVTVTTSNGSDTVEDGFEYIPDDVVLPIITDVSPPEGDEGTEVTITGENFQDGASVIICGQEVAATFVSDTELTFIAPACEEGGPQDVTVVNPDDGSATAPDAFTYPTVIVDPPTIDDGPDAIDPSEGPLAGGQTVTITGTNFVDGDTEVLFGETPGTDVIVSPDGMTLTVATPPGTEPGAVDVTVTTPNGEATAPAGYTYLPDPPTIDPNNGLSPPSGPVSGGTVVIIKGTGFVEGMDVTFDGEPGTDLIVHDSMTLEVTSPPAPSGVPGPVDVTVTTSAGSDTAEGGFTYTEEDVVPPIITEVSPPVGEEGTEVTIDGEGFQDGAIVTICGVDVTPESVTPTEIVFLAPPCDEVGVPQDVTVCNLDDGCVTEDAAFTYETPEDPLGEPTITGLDPNAGPHAGGTVVIILGTNFVAGAEVMFGDALAESVEVLSPTVMRVSSPPSGLPITEDALVDVTVTTEGGTVVMADAFTYTAVGPPVIGPVPGSITPPTGPLSGGTEVTITGSNFVPGDTDVSFGGNPGTNVTVAPDGMSLTVVTPPGDEIGPVDVTVSTSAGDDTVEDGFTYHADDVVSPIITDVQPPEGDEGTEVTITGDNFQDGAEVIICGQVVTPVSVTPTEIVFIAPACEEGGPQDVTVLNPDDGSATAPDAFTYPEPSVGPPQIGPVPGSITPPTGPIAGGTTVTIKGSNFVPGETEVLFGGKPGTNVTVSPDGMSLTVVTPPGDALGPVDVTVTTPNGSDTVEDGFTYHADDVVPPVIIGVTPPEGEEGTEVTIEGENFQEGATVIICGQEVTPVSVTPTEIVFIAPACEEGGPQDVTVVNPDGGSATAPDAFTYPEPAVVYRQLFAEGAIGTFFRTNVGVLNASKTEPANIVFTVYPDTPDSAVEVPFTLDPLTRRTIDLSDVLGPVAAGASVRIESDQPIAGLRQMLWDDTSYGSHLESGQPDTSTEWYFGEGATHIFDVFHLLLNENDEDANVTITYLRGQGQGPPVVQNVVVPANTRQTIWANAVPGLEAVEISAVITSDLPIVAERAMYLNGPRAFEAGQAGAGTTAPSTVWNIAEGATHFFDTFLFFSNPNDEEALVTVTYLLPNGSTVVKQHTVPAQAKRTILVDVGEDPQLQNTAFSATVSATVPIIAERAMWWGPTSLSWYEAHASLATTETGTVFGIGEAMTGGPDEEDTYVLVSNGSTTDAPVRFTLVYDDGTTEEKTINLLASSRLTVLITTEFPNSEGRRFSILVESLNDIPMNVEVSRYQSTGGLFGHAGGTAQATKIQ